MVNLIEVNEDNWLEVASLSVTEEQQAYLDSPVGIIARGYAYRNHRARVIGIEGDGELVGLALVKDLDEEPACYDLQQFMIDRRYQNRGYGTAALGMILAELRRERKYDCVEVCVKKSDAAAIRVYEKAGFRDTGYVDADAPDCLNLMYRFGDEGEAFTDRLVTDFGDPAFREAFRKYFREMDVSVEDWEGLFREMNDGGNEAFLRISGGDVAGFIQFCPITFKSWFFEGTIGFVREFWVAPERRGEGHGSALLRLAEERFREKGYGAVILTTDTAEDFYLARGYGRAPGIQAKNKDDVFVKQL